MNGFFNCFYFTYYLVCTSFYTAQFNYQVTYNFQIANEVTNLYRKYSLTNYENLNREENLIAFKQERTEKNSYVFFVKKSETDCVFHLRAKMTL
jgi:hypothetical protein